MDAADGNSLAAIGFLTALRDSTHGWFGGYLVLSHLGRPLEFHCTTPIEPTRVQQILYGPTLQPYLLGDVIGHTLVRRAELPVQAILTDLPEMLSLSLLRPEVVACVDEKLIPAAGIALAKATTPDQRPVGERAGAVPGQTDDPQPHLEIGTVQLYGTSTCSWEPARLR